MEWAHSFSAKVIVPSHAFGKRLVEERSVLPDRLHPILNGCNTTEFSLSGPQDAELNRFTRPIWLCVTPDT
jgi:hypothetical protein